MIGDAVGLGYRGKYLSVNFWAKGGNGQYGNEEGKQWSSRHWDSHASASTLRQPVRLGKSISNTIFPEDDLPLSSLLPFPFQNRFLLDSL